MRLSRRHVDAEGVLALDVGQTGSRFALCSDGERERGDAPALVAGAELVPALVEIVAAVAGRLDGRRAIDVVAIGATGLNGRPAPAVELHDRLTPLLANRRTILADDSVTAYLGALGDRPGAVVAAGTGVVVIASDGRARSARVDGAGYLIGDAGSGFWIGRAGLDSAVRASDGRDGSHALLAAAEGAFGDLEALPASLAARSDRVAAIASFARAVAAEANRGDPHAIRICEAAAVELAGSAAAALERCGLGDQEVDVALTGSLAGAGRLLTEPFERSVGARCPRSRVVAPDGDGLAGAAALASASLRAFGSLVASAES